MTNTPPANGRTVCDHGAMDGQTPRRAIRIDDSTWQTATERARREHRTVSDVVRIALHAYAEGRYDALPEPSRRKP